MHQFLDDRTCFTLYEHWRSKDDLDQHLQMPYLQALLGKADDLRATAPDIQGETDRLNRKKEVKTDWKAARGDRKVALSAC